MLWEQDFSEAMAEATQEGTHAVRAWRRRLHCMWNGSFVSFCSQDQHSTAGASVDCTSLAMVRCKVLSMIALENNNSFPPFLSRGFTQEPHPRGYQAFVACTVPQPHKHCLFVSLFFWSAYVGFSEKGIVYGQWTTQYLLLTALLQISMKTATSSSLWVWINRCYFFNQ